MSPRAEGALPTAGPAIETRELTRRFGGFVALERLSLAISPGEIFGLLGPNGAGKTTLMRMLTGLLAPTSGEGRVAGCDITRESDRIKRQIGYMAQIFCLYPDLTVRENLDFFGGMYGLEGARLAERRGFALELAGVTDLADRLTAELPLGWKQRLALASAVMHDPEILVLDEPTSGVDPVSRRAFWRLIESLAETGKTVLISTHHVEEAEYCGRIALLNQGRLAALGTPRELKRSLENRVLEVELEGFARALGGIERAPGVTNVALFGRRLHVTVEDRERAERELPALLTASGARVRRIERVVPTLEDAVMTLIRRSGRAAGS